MIKHRFVIYIKEDEKKRLENKAKECGFEGRGSVSHYVSKIANEPIAFIDDKLKKILVDKRKEK